MDAQAVFWGLGGGGVMVTVGIAIGKSMTTGREIGRLARKLHEIEDWRNATLPKEYVQQRELSLTLKPLTDSLERVETQQSAIAKDLTTLTRWIDQHGGAIG